MANEARVRDELESYSDYRLHQFAHEWHRNKKFAALLLDPCHIWCSAKFAFLRDLLPRLKVPSST